MHYVYLFNNKKELIIITRTIGPNGEIITVLPITIKVDRSTNSYYAQEESTGRRIPIAELLQMANDGDPSAQCAMGDYYNVEEPHADFKEAFNWYKKAAAQNHAQALFNMGNYYAVGAGVVQKDMDKSIAFLEESANQGFLDAMMHLGQLYTINDLYDKAFIWLEKAEKLGHPDAGTILEQARTLARSAANSPSLRETFSNDRDDVLWYV